MLWFFDRNDQHLRLETRYDNATSEYVLVVNWPDGREDTERFTDREAYRQRLAVMESRLEAERWMRHGPPVILPDGWPDRRPT
ncbi:MAG: hypothetical protein WBD07_14655 [Vicinamibacterales bacterium]